MGNNHECVNYLHREEQRKMTTVVMIWILSQLNAPWWTYVLLLLAFCLKAAWNAILIQGDKKE